MFPNALQLTNLQVNRETSYLVLQYIFMEWLNETPVKERSVNEEAGHILG